MLKKNSFYTVNKEATHVTAHNSTLMDIIATTNPESIYEVNNASLSLSNHDGLIVSLQHYKPPRKTFTRKIFDYS